MEKPEAVLVNWKIDEDVGRVYGDVFGHTTIQDGHFIRSSTIVNIDRSNSDIIVETLNTKYKLKRGRGLVGGVGDGFIL
jgi:hypothetical protein